MNTRQRRVAFLVVIAVVLITLSMYLPQGIGFCVSMLKWHTHPRCAMIEGMLFAGKHPTRREVLKMIGPPIHIYDGGSKRAKPYTEEDMWKSRYWGYGWKQYELPVIIDLDSEGKVKRIRHGWA